MVRALLAGLAAMVLAAVLAAWVVPGQLDWNQYRTPIAALASSALGRSVRIDGPISLAVLPQPLLTASAVSVAEGGDGVSLSVGQMRLQVALGPLLAGRVEVRSVRLHQAALRLPWPPPSGLLAQRPAGWLHGFRAHVDDSRMLAGPFELTGVDGDIEADAETGALSASGAAIALGQPWRANAALGQPGGDGGATLDARLEGEAVMRGTGGSFSGQVAPDGSVAGRVTASGQDLSLLLPAPMTPWRAEGRLTASGGLVVGDELALEIGGAPAHGAVALRLLPAARLDMALAASSIALDAWLPRLLGGGPIALPTGIDLSAEAATLMAGTLRHVRAGFEATADGVAVRAAEAVLPGGAALHLDGQMHDGAFQGAGRIDAPDLRATLAWLRQLAPALVDAPPPAALARADITADVRAGPDHVALGNLQGRLNGAALTGDLALSLGPRPAVAATLTLDGLPLDPWIAAPPDSLPALAHLLASVPDRIAGFDADLTVALHHATWRETPLEPATVDGRAFGGQLELRRLEAVAGGTRFTASGSIGPEGRVSDGVVDLAMPDAALLAGQLPAGLRSGPASLHAALGGPVNALGVDGKAQVGDLRAGANVRLDLTAPHAAGSVSLLHPSAKRLAEMFGLTDAASWLGDGSMSLLGELDAKPDHVHLERGELSAGALRASLALDLDRAGRTLSGTVTADTLPLPRPGSTDPLPLEWMHGYDASLHVRAAQILVGSSPVLDQAVADLTLRQGVARVEKLSGSLASGHLTGEAMLDTTQIPPILTLDGRVAGMAARHPLFGTIPDLAGGTLDAAVDVTATGYSPAALLATAVGKASARMADGTLIGIDVAGAAAALANPQADAIEPGVRAALTDGSTRFTQLDAAATIAGGVATLGPSTVRLAGAGVTASGTVDLSGNRIALRITVDPASETLPALGVQLIGPPSDPRRTIDLTGLAHWLSERPSPPVQ